MKPIKEEGFYALARFDKDNDEFLGLHYKDGMLAVYTHISSAKQVRTRLSRMSGTKNYKIVKMSITIDESTIVEIL